MLKLRQIIPPLTARAADGRAVQAWDFKQKHSLAIVFLHAGCRPCADYLERMRENAAELKEREAVALVIFSETQSSHENFPAQIVVAADVSGKSQRAFLGEDAFGPAGQELLGVFAHSCSVILWYRAMGGSTGCPAPPTRPAWRGTAGPWDRCRVWAWSLGGW